jgi:hypothetical protein
MFHVGSPEVVPAGNTGGGVGVGSGATVAANAALLPELGAG